MNRVNAYAITSPSIEKEVVKAYVTDDIVKQKHQKPFTCREETCHSIFIKQKSSLQ